MSVMGFRYSKRTGSEIVVDVPILIAIHTVTLVLALLYLVIGFLHTSTQDTSPPAGGRVEDPHESDMTARAEARSVSSAELFKSDAPPPPTKYTSADLEKDNGEV
ncbi:hypothetical protein BU16DRAFT_87097 [Lophium mytilinum]|uniref:Uncharacterized protein n=1 Tax=Lophium mytilinum TaxID=390894 RepID=A0A6A6QKV8_9PEZI|nr:hypothetical protein BU16DRAFT_87097 [Lophium mytilinum]